MLKAGDILIAEFAYKNQSGLIGRAIQSVLNQTYRDF